MKKPNFLLSPRSYYNLLPLLFIFLFASCEKEAVPELNASRELNAKASSSKVTKVNTYYGPAEPFGKGVVRAMVRMNRDGSPEAIGVKISEKVLEALPEEHESLTLQMPRKMHGLVFDHIDLDWNPHGHEPFFYELPHFDVHFYMISEEEKNEIMPLDPEDIVLPEERFWPEGYFLPANDIVPNMGMHWLSYFAPELAGADFTHTFIYGSWQEDFIFYEPMITLDYLVNEANGEPFPIAQPLEFQQNGYYYPTSYSMDYDPTKKEYTIILDQMVLR